MNVNGSPVTALERAIGKHPVEAVILPSDSRQNELLESIKRGFAALKVIQTSAKGLALAIRNVTNEVPTHIKGAIALGRRTISPREHWLSLDPVSLGSPNTSKNSMEMLCVPFTRICRRRRAGTTRRVGGADHQGACTTACASEPKITEPNGEVYRRL